MTARRHLLLPFLTAALLLGVIPATLPPSLAAGDSLLTRSQAMYAGLRSYADSGTVTYEFGPPGGQLREQYAFITRYRGPRHFFFDFSNDANSGDRFVIWGDDDAFHTWWSATGVEEEYPKGRGAGAFTVSSTRTKGSSVMISPLLFSGAGLQGTLTELGEVTDAGVEEINGHSTHKLSGVAKSVYPTGYVTNVRRVAVWIDPGTLLVHQVFEDTPRGTPAGTISRITMRFEPRADPSLEDAQFTFVVPSTQD